MTDSAEGRPRERGPRLGARADTVFRGGAVWVEMGKSSSALAVAGDRIIALGARAEALAKTARQIVELDGGTLLPAFSDGHCHPVSAGLELAGPAIKGAASIEEIQAAVGSYAAEHPGDDWIVGGSYDPALAPEGRFDAAWLDAIVPGRPVVLRAADYHTAWCNTAALARAGISAATPDPPLGRVERRDDGSPLGTLREWHAVDMVLAVAPAPTAQALTEALRRACSAQNAVGVTWMQDAWVDRGGQAPYLELAAAGELTVRSNLAFRADPDHWEDQLAEFQDARAAVRALGRSALLRAETVKFFADGVIEGATAAMLEPYVGTADRGMPVWSDSELARAVGAFDALGFQAHIHAIGDAAIRAGLDAIETAIRENPLWDRRPVIAHVQLVDPLDLERFGQLGVVANFESYWSQPDPLQVTLTAPRLGAERTDRQYPAATLAELGAVLSHGSDWPVSTNNPVEAIWVAATRQTAAGDPPGGWVPTERLTLDQAIEAATWGSAYQGWTDAYRGRARVGYQADLVALTADLAEDGWRPADAAVAGVWLAGRQVG